MSGSAGGGTRIAFAGGLLYVDARSFGSQPVRPGGGGIGSTLEGVPKRKSGFSFSPVVLPEWPLED
jgi:hypothetical protein